MHRLSLALLLLAAGCDGCGKMDRYQLREVPFCASEKAGFGGEFTEDYTVLVKWRSGYSIQGFNATFRDAIFIGDDEPLMAVVSCAQPHGSLQAEEVMKKFTEDHVPTICAGMRVLFHGRLEANEDALSKARGYAGFHVFPEVAVKCTTGTVERRERYTLSQILRDFSDAVGAYLNQHEDQFPKSMEELQKDTALEPLPTDPWGSEIVFQLTSDKIVLISPGPDKKLGTEDDIEVMERSKNGHRSITTFEGSDYPMMGDYTAFLEKRAAKE